MIAAETLHDGATTNFAGTLLLVAVRTDADEVVEEEVVVGEEVRYHHNGMVVVVDDEQEDYNQIGHSGCCFYTGRNDPVTALCHHSCCSCCFYRRHRIDHIHGQDFFLGHVSDHLVLMFGCPVGIVQTLELDKHFWIINNNNNVDTLLTARPRPLTRFGFFSPRIYRFRIPIK